MGICSSNEDAKKLDQRDRKLSDGEDNHVKVEIKDVEKQKFDP